MSRKLSQYSCDISISYYGVEAANGCSFFLWGPLENAQALSDTATWSLGQEMAFFTPALTEWALFLKLLVEGQDYFMDHLGCRLGEIFADELVCISRCQSKLSSGKIQSQNYLASLSKSLHSRLSWWCYVSTYIRLRGCMAFFNSDLLTADYHSETGLRSYPGASLALPWPLCDSPVLGL